MKKFIFKSGALYYLEIEETLNSSILFLVGKIVVDPFAEIPDVSVFEPNGEISYNLILNEVYPFYNPSLGKVENISNFYDWILSL